MTILSTASTTEAVLEDDTATGASGELATTMPSEEYVATKNADADVQAKAIAALNRSLAEDNAEKFAEECSGNLTQSIDMMIGIALKKDSDAIFFQYLGETEEHLALMANGKPLTKLEKVTVTGIEIAEDVGEYNSTKLNLFLTTGASRTVMVTCGLQTFWTQCVLTGLMDVFNSGILSSPITIECWKGTKSKFKPTFAAIRADVVLGDKVIKNAKFSDTELYNSFTEARSDKDEERTEALCRDCIEVLSKALEINMNGLAIEPVSIKQEQAGTVDVGADF